MVKIILKKPVFLHSQLLFLQLQKDYLHNFVTSMLCSNQLKLKMILAVYQSQPAVHCSASLHDLNLHFTTKLDGHENLASNSFPFMLLQ